MNEIENRQNLTEMESILKQEFGAIPILNSIDKTRQIWASDRKLLVVQQGSLHQMHDISDLDEHSRSEILNSL